MLFRCTLVVYAGMLVGTTTSAEISSGTPDRPNILFILADDLGYGDVGCFNEQSRVRTPHLDRLAREGLRLTDAHSPSTVCTPTRYSILTGRMAFRTGMEGVFTGAGGLPDDRLAIRLYRWRPHSRTTDATPGSLATASASLLT